MIRIYPKHQLLTTWEQQRERSVMDSVLELPEFANLQTLRRTCTLFAESTKEQTEFNLYVRFYNKSTAESGGRS